MRVGARIVICITLVLLFVIFNGVAEGGLATTEDCAGLQGDAYKDCIMQIHMYQRLLREEEEKARREKERPPALVSATEIPRPYGYWIGDFTELSWRLEFQPGVQVNLSPLPLPGAKVGMFVVRDRKVNERILPSGIKEVRVHYTIQNFAVLCKQSYVDFGPLEVFWRKNQEGKWRQLLLPAAKILISPISLCSELPDEKLMPKEMMEFSRLTLNWVLVGLGAVFMAGALLVFATGLREMYRRYETSPLWKARQILSRSDIEIMEAIGAFRTALREKFGISGADSKEEVRAKFSALPFWSSCAQEAASLWEETTAILYEGKTAQKEVIGRIRSFINKLSRMEVDE
jgi:hypothetical protein